MGYSGSELKAAGDRRAGFRIRLAFEYKVSPRQVISTNPSQPDKQQRYGRGCRLHCSSSKRQNDYAECATQKITRALTAFIRHRVLDLFSFRYTEKLLVPAFALE